MMMIHKLLSRFSNKTSARDDNAYTIYNKSNYPVYILRVKPTEQNFVECMLIEPNQAGEFQYTRDADLKLLYLAKRDLNIIRIGIRRLKFGSAEFENIYNINIEKRDTNICDIYDEKTCDMIMHEIHKVKYRTLTIENESKYRLYIMGVPYEDGKYKINSRMDYRESQCMVVEPKQTGRFEFMGTAYITCYIEMGTTIDLLREESLLGLNDKTYHFTDVDGAACSRIPLSDNVARELREGDWNTFARMNIGGSPSLYNKI
jgi:hypothetical protein